MEPGLNRSMPFKKEDWKLLNDVHIQADPNKPQAIFTFQGQSYSIQLVTKKIDVYSLDTPDWLAIAQKVVVILQKKELLHGGTTQVANIHKQGITFSQQNDAEIAASVAHKNSQKSKNTQQDYIDLIHYLGLDVLSRSSSKLFSKPSLPPEDSLLKPQKKESVTEQESVNESKLEDQKPADLPLATPVKQPPSFIFSNAQMASLLNAFTPKHYPSNFQTERSNQAQDSAQSSMPKQSERTEASEQPSGSKADFKEVEPDTASEASSKGSEVDVEAFKPSQTTVEEKIFSHLSYIANLMKENPVKDSHELIIPSLSHEETVPSDKTIYYLAKNDPEASPNFAIVEQNGVWSWEFTEKGLKKFLETLEIYFVGLSQLQQAADTQNQIRQEAFTNRVEEIIDDSLPSQPIPSTSQTDATEKVASNKYVDTVSKRSFGASKQSLEDILKLFQQARKFQETSGYKITTPEKEQRFKISFDPFVDQVIKISEGNLTSILMEMSRQLKKQDKAIQERKEDLLHSMSTPLNETLKGSDIHLIHQIKTESTKKKDEPFKRWTFDLDKKWSLGNREIRQFKQVKPSSKSRSNKDLFKGRVQMMPTPIQSQKLVAKQSLLNTVASNLRRVRF